MMMRQRPFWTRSLTFGLTLLLLGFTGTAPAREPARVVKEAAPEEIQAFFKEKNMTVLTFLGYSGAEYEDKAEDAGAGCQNPGPV